MLRKRKAEPKPKMRKSCSLKYHAVCFLLEYLFLLAMTSLALGQSDIVSEEKCEYEDVNLIWPNMPVYSLNDVKVMEWYKEKDSLIATWMEGKGMKEYPPYIGRLMQIGETGIKLKRANRSDSGSYRLYLTLASRVQTLEAVINLKIMAAPSSKCKPKITEEGSILKADLPSEGCGTPPLTLKWKNTSKTVIKESHSSNLLDLGSNSESGEYIVCAEGDSAMCYHGNISDLCTGLSKSQLERREDGFTPAPESIILPIALIALIAFGISVLVVIRRKQKWCCRTRRSEDMCETEEVKLTDIEKSCPSNEEYPLIQKEDASRNDFLPGFPEIQNYLRGLYKDMTSVSLSPTGKEPFVDVSEVYIDLDFQQIEIEDFKYKESDLNWTRPYNASVSKEDIHIVKAHRQNVSPIIIVGCKGSGKSTWCKHLVHCWSQNSKTQDANVEGIHLPNLEEYQILLYLPLKSSDRGLLFQELLQHILFVGQPEYLNIITMYIHDKSHGRSILILVDGFDRIGEYVELMSEILNHKLFSLCTVIFTCRPSSLRPIFNACVDNSKEMELFKVCEISLDKSLSYASKVLSRFNEQNKHFNINTFFTFTRNFHVQSLLQLPYICLTLIYVWMENKNPYLDITDILLCIVEHLLNTVETGTRCKENIMKLSQRNSPEVRTSINKLNERFVRIKGLMYELSMTTADIFLSKTKGLKAEEKLVRRNSATGKNTLPLEVLYEIGLITESVPLKSAKTISTLTFTNELIYQLFLSMAIAFKKGDAFDYIVSDMEIALKHSMIIHMLWQFSPTLGKEMFVEISKLKTEKLEKLGLGKQTNKFRNSNVKKYQIKSGPKNIQYHEVSWLQLLMYNGDLDDDKLLFLTNALRSIDLLASLVLENNESNDDLVFWLPCSQTLKKLELNIKNCTLLLCPEWNNQLPLKLEEVVIKSVIISREDVELLCKAFSFCKNIKKQEMSPTNISTDDTEIVS